MFDLQKYSSRLAIRSDIGESITYAELTVETEKFHDAIPYDGLVFILCENNNFLNAAMRNTAQIVWLDGAYRSIML